MNNKTNIEDTHTIMQIRNMFEHLKNHGWINDIKRDIDTQKAVKSIENILAKANAYDSLVEKIGNKFKTRRIELLKKDKEPENDIVLDTLQELLDTKQ